MLENPHTFLMKTGSQLLSAEEVKPSEIINTRSILLGGGESNVQ